MAARCLPVLNAPGAPRSPPENRENSREDARSALASVRGTNWFRKGDAGFFSRASRRPRYPPPIPASSFSFSHGAEPESISLSRAPGLTLARLILRVLYLGEKSMSTDMLTRVQTWRARELARKETGRRDGRGKGEVLEVGMQCRISPGLWERKGRFAPREGERERTRETHTSLRMRVGGHTHMRVRAHDVRAPGSPVVS